MKKGENLNPARDYVLEYIVKAIGGYFFWLVKGRSTSLKEELQKDVRNVITTIIIFALVVILILYVTS